LTDLDFKTKHNPVGAAKKAGVQGVRGLCGAGGGVSPSSRNRRGMAGLGAAATTWLFAGENRHQSGRRKGPDRGQVAPMAVPCATEVGPALS
jgi:hypothetical protein